MLKIFSALLAAVLSLTTAPTQAAADFPSKPVKIVVAFGPGSGSDILARLLGQYLQAELNTPIVVENKPGALGQIATLSVAQSTPDGYTLGMGSSSTHSTATFLTKNLPYNPIKDFAAVGSMNRYTFVLLVNADTPFKTPKELVDHLKKQGTGFYGFGNASGRVGAAHLRKLTGTQVTEVPYKSSPEAMSDLAAGRFDYMFNSWESARPFIESGRLRAIGVMADERSPVLPDMPAVGETYPGFDFINWGGLMAPAGTPDDVIQKLNTALQTVLKNPELKNRMMELGMEVHPSSPQELADLVAQQQRAWGAAIKGADISLE
ncbi:MAG: tripartite tricarboxylate transporter substrate binding protein [Burkholderiaceae bacterium]